MATTSLPVVLLKNVGLDPEAYSLSEKENDWSTILLDGQAWHLEIQSSAIETLIAEQVIGGISFYFDLSREDADKLNQFYQMCETKFQAPPFFGISSTRSCCNKCQYRTPLIGDPKEWLHERPGRMLVRPRILHGKNGQFLLENVEAIFPINK